MDIKKTVQRLCIFFFGIPLTLSIIFLTSHHYLVMNLFVMLTAVLSSIELYGIFKRKIPLLPLPFVSTLTFFVPLSAYLLTVFDKHIDYASCVFFVCVMLVMAGEIFFVRDYKDSIARISGSIFIIFYCGFFPTFITRMTLLTHPTLKISLFLSTVFMNDSLAWFFGMLFGRTNRGIFRVSPNKSVAGLVGGFLGALATSVIFQFLFHSVLSGSYWKSILLSVLSTAGGVVGDLSESVLKRSSGMKDSGTLVPGRGGVLDSIDSVFFTAPIFYVAAHMLF